MIETKEWIFTGCLLLFGLIYIAGYYSSNWSLRPLLIIYCLYFILIIKYDRNNRFDSKRIPERRIKSANNVWLIFGCSQEQL